MCVCRGFLQAQAASAAVDADAGLIFKTGAQAHRAELEALRVLLWRWASHRPPASLCPTRNTLHSHLASTAHPCASLQSEHQASLAQPRTHPLLLAAPACAGEAGAWDEAGVGHPVVRYYLGDNEQRWYMWYTGRSRDCPDLDALFPSSGSIGAQGLVLAGRCVALRSGAKQARQ